MESSVEELGKLPQNGSLLFVLKPYHAVQAHHARFRQYKVV
jgi:hypothetical protein